MYDRYYFSAFTFQVLFVTIYRLHRYRTWSRNHRRNFFFYL